MTSWFKKEVGDGVAAFGPSMKVQEMFLTLARTGQDMSKIAVFSQNDNDTNIITLYFTPESEILAYGFNAKPCEKPVPKSGFGLLVGEMNIWDHFPDYISKRRE